MNTAQKIKKLRLNNNLSQEQFAKLIGRSRSVVAAWEIGRIEPGRDALRMISKVFNVSIDYLADKSSTIVERNIPEKSAIREVALTPVPITTVYIRGEVQAGKWHAASEWPQQDWIPLAIPIPEKYKDFPWYALYVRGDSMNLVFPEGTVIIVVNFSDLGRNPESGECVVAIRRDPLTETFEATVKIVQIRNDGRVFLWPRSDNPDFLKPIILPHMTREYQYNGLDGDGSSTPDLLMQGLVIGSYRSVGKMQIR